MTITDRLAGINEGVAVKAPCIVATTAAITLSGTQTIDGIAVVAGDRVLVKDQTTGSENGIYTVSTGAWSRAPDFNGTRDVVQGSNVFALSGTTNGGKWYQLSTASPVVGTSALSFTEVTASARGVANTAFVAANEAVNADVDAGLVSTSILTPKKGKRGYTTSPWFSQAWTGATTRSPQAKDRDFQCSADATGIDATGVSSSSSAIQALFDGINGLGGATAWFKPGTYLIGTQITLRSNLTIRPDGEGDVIFKTLAGRTDDMFVGTSLSNVHIEGVIFDGNELDSGTATGTGSSGANTITVSAVTGAISAGMRLYGTGVALNAYVRSYNSGTGVVTIEDAAHADLNNTGTVSGTITFNKVGIGLLTFASCSNVSVERCLFRKFTVRGLQLNNPTQALVRSNYFYKTTASRHSTNNAISIDDSAGRGSYVWVDSNICVNSGIISIGNYVHFTNNDISGWKYGAGIAVGYSVANGASLYNTVIGNSCASGSGTDSDGYDLKGIECYGYYTRIIGNQLFGNSGPGIVASNSYTTIIGNTCYNNCTYGNADTAGINLNYSTVTVGTATGTGSNGVNTITVTGVSGTIAVGYAVTGTNIAANALVRSYNAGTGVVTLEFSGGADANNTGAVSGTISFSTHWGAHTSTVIGNICFDTAGAGGTQNYGIELDYRLLQLSIYANQCESNKLGAYRVNNGGSSATTLSCSFVGQSYLYSFTWNASSISNGASLQQAETVSGAELGDLLTTSCSIALNGLTLTAEVHATNTIYITLTNNSGGAVDLASATFRIRGEKPLY